MDTDISIPVIDISTSNPSAPQQLLTAASRYGFLFIKNSAAAVSPQSIDEIFHLSRTFFAAPEHEKNSVSIASNHAGKNHGWLSQGIEKLDPKTQARPDVKEALNIGEPINDRLQQPLPPCLQAHEQTIIAFQAACHALCQRILEHIATALEIEKTWFTARHDRENGPSGTVFRLLYYPDVKVDEDGLDVRAGAHSDYGSITLLFQRPGQPGLEIKTPSGEWAAVPVNPAHPDIHNSPASVNGVRNGDVNGDEISNALPILVNIGDLLEDWTGGLLKSTVHRVIFPHSGNGGDRYSIAYFCHPLDDALLEPVPSRLVQDYVAQSERNGKGRRDGKIITARDHLMERLAATYKVT